MFSCIRRLYCERLTFIEVAFLSGMLKQRQMLSSLYSALIIVLIRPHSFNRFGQLSEIVTSYI